MHKFAIGSTLTLIMTPHDFAAYRASPIDDHSKIDCEPFGAPNAVVVIFYAEDASRAIKFMGPRTHQISNNEGTGTLCWSGSFMFKKAIGIVLTEVSMKRLEADPLLAHETFDGKEFGVSNFKVMITYSDTDRKVVNFLRSLGVPMAKIATDPAMARLWQQFGQEVIADSVRVANQMGANIVPTDIPHEIMLGEFGKNGMTEEALLAVRAEELAWFQSHPDQTEYIRRAVVGEFPPEVGAEYVKVIKAEPEGVRYRIPGRIENGVFIQGVIGTK